MSIKDKVVIITGAGQGIGAVYATAFATHGARVVIADINMETAEKHATALRQRGYDCLPASVDISSAEDVISLKNNVMQNYGRIDVLINNAAMFSSLKMKPFHQIPTEEWDRLFAVNVRGVFLCCKEISGIMIQQKSGRIINMSSGVADDGRPNYLHYVASKAAVNGMTRGLATELGAYGITVNAISPYGMQTEIQKETESDSQRDMIIERQALRVQATPESLVGTALYLADEEMSGFVTGQTLYVNGGYMYK
ncbi:SDR family NAD(P)-dependent oxidoreductase [Castellaniella sp. WN]